METLHVKATSRTPEIIFNPSINSFSIKGKFFPENIKDFLIPILDWLENYKNSKAKSIELQCQIDYLSSSSVIYLKQIFLKFSEFKAVGTEINVLWYYDEDDEDIRKTGEYYVKNSNLNFIFKEN